MVELRIEQALLLHNLRKKKANKESGEPFNKGAKNKMDLAKLIWPEARNPDVYMSKLVKGAQKTIRPQSIEIICHELVVDPNFLFGFPSQVHDQEFNELLKDN